MVAQQGDTTGGSETWQNSLARICSLLRRFFSGNTLSVFGKTRLLWRQWIIYRHAILIIAHFVSCRHKIGVYFCSRVNWSYFLSHLRLLFHIIRTYCAATSSTRIDKVALPKVEIIRKKYSDIRRKRVFIIYNIQSCDLETIQIFTIYGEKNCRIFTKLWANRSISFFMIDASVTDSGG